MSTYRRPKTDEARERANARARQYRHEHPEAVRRWRDTYTLKRADRLRAEQAQMEGGEQHD